MPSGAAAQAVAEVVEALRKLFISALSGPHKAYHVTTACAVGCFGDGILQQCLRTSSSISDAFSRLGRRHVVMIEAVKHREAAMPAV